MKNHSGLFEAVLVFVDQDVKTVLRQIFDLQFDRLLSCINEGNFSSSGVVDAEVVKQLPRID